MCWLAHPLFLHEDLTFLCLQPHARCHPEGGGNGGEYGNYDLDNLSPNAFVVVFVVAHNSLVFSFS